MVLDFDVEAPADPQDDGHLSMSTTFEAAPDADAPWSATGKVLLGKKACSKVPKGPCSSQPGISLSELAKDLKTPPCAVQGFHQGCISSQERCTGGRSALHSTAHPAGTKSKQGRGS